jgi:hypothetical protein
VLGAEPTDFVNWECAGATVNVAGLISQSLVPVAGPVLAMTYIDPIGYAIDASQQDKVGLFFDGIGTAGTLIALFPGPGQGIGAMFDAVSTTYGAASCFQSATGR